MKENWKILRTGETIHVLNACYGNLKFRFTLYPEIMTWEVGMPLLHHRVLHVMNGGDFLVGPGCLTSLQTHIIHRITVLTTVMFILPVLRAMLTMMDIYFQYMGMRVFYPLSSTGLKKIF